MQHLSLEELARLVDEAPEAEEARHLEACPACRAELEALGEQTRALAALPLPAAPRPAWPVLERRLRAEGLVEGAGARRWSMPLLRLAASFAFFVAGGVTAAMLLGSPAGPPPAEAPVAYAPPAPVAVPVARSPEAAARQLRAAEAAYREALTQYAEATGAAQGMDPVNRLAALEGIVLTTSAALKVAPADPVINGYHLTAVSQRDAILRQIETTGEAGEEWF